MTQLAEKYGFYTGKLIEERISRVPVDLKATRLDYEKIKTHVIVKDRLTL